MNPELAPLWAGVGATLVVAVAAGLWRAGVEGRRWLHRRAYREALVNDVVGRMKDTRRFQLVLNEWQAGERGHSVTSFPLNSPVAAFWRLVSAPFLEAGATPGELGLFGRFYEAVARLENWERLSEMQDTRFGSGFTMRQPPDSTRAHAMALDGAAKEALGRGDLVLQRWGTDELREAARST